MASECRFTELVLLIRTCRLARLDAAVQIANSRAVDQHIQITAPTSTLGEVPDRVTPAAATISLKI
jgi:hypothetical protein